MMCIRPIRPFTALALVLALRAPSLEGQGGLRLAAIEGAEEGVGILRPRAAGECYVVVPRHVADPEHVDDLSAIPDGGTRIELDKVLDRYSADLGLWRMERRMGRTACAPWPSTAQVNRALERALDRETVGTVTPQIRGGPGEPVPVRIAALTGTSFRIYPRPGRKLAEGMSGSPVHVNGTLVGIVTEIVLPDDNGVSDGVSFGVALRLDYVEEHLGRFFNPGRPPGDPLILASMAVPGLGQARTRRPEAALLWAGVAAGPTLYAFFTSRNEQVQRTRRLQDGRDEIYFETRSVNPYRGSPWGSAAVWRHGPTPGATTSRRNAPIRRSAAGPVSAWTRDSHRMPAARPAFSSWRSDSKPGACSSSLPSMRGLQTP
jgi:hypothetical protein